LILLPCLLSLSFKLDKSNSTTPPIFHDDYSQLPVSPLLFPPRDDSSTLPTPTSVGGRPNYCSCHHPLHRKWLQSSLLIVDGQTRAICRCLRIRLLASPDGRLLAHPHNCPLPLSNFTHPSLCPRQYCTLPNLIRTLAASSSIPSFSKENRPSCQELEQ
jgi:hypothetical protein